MDLSKYDDNELKIAITNLSKHVNNKDAFSLEKLNAGLGPEIKGDLSRKMYRRSYFKIVSRFFRKYNFSRSVGDSQLTM